MTERNQKSLPSRNPHPSEGNRHTGTITISCRKSTLEVNMRVWRKTEQEHLSRSGQPSELLSHILHSEPFRYIFLSDKQELTPSTPSALFKCHLIEEAFPEKSPAPLYPLSLLSSPCHLSSRLHLFNTYYRSSIKSRDGSLLFTATSLYPEPCLVIDRHLMSIR